MIEHASKSSTESAQKYVQRHWRVIPVPYKSKGPVLPGWQHLRLTEANVSRYFHHGLQNIGVLLGEPSEWLIDVDIDHAAAIAIATRHLPATSCIFGRESKPRSHWLYRTARPVSTRQWRLPSRRMVIELRSTGGQTIFPGSVHPSGEPIEWDTDGEPALVDPNVLQDRLQRIYADVCGGLNLSPRRQPVKDRTDERLAPARIVERARKYLAKVPPAVSGQGGHDATFHAACVLVSGFGLDRQQAVTLLGEWNDTCQPPWTDKELEHKVDDAMKQPGWRGYLLTGSDRQTVTPLRGAIERANRHAIEHRRRARRRAHV